MKPSALIALLVATGLAATAAAQQPPAPGGGAPPRTTGLSVTFFTSPRMAGPLPGILVSTSIPTSRSS